MRELPEPTKALADRILSEVSFDERFIGWRIRERTGATPLTLYSLGEIFGLLNEPYPGIDLTQLEKWLRDVMGDAALANRVKEVADEDASDLEKTTRIKVLMEERLRGAIMMQKNR